MAYTSVLRTEISRVNVFAAEKYERRRESFEKSAIDAMDFVSFLFFLFLRISGRTVSRFIDERSLLNFNTNLDIKEGGG